MTGPFLKLTALAAAAALLALTVKKQTPEISLAITIAGCCAAAVLAFSYVEPLMRMVRTLSEQAGLHLALAVPLYKTLGISLLTRVCAAVCRDAGQEALSRITEIGGGLLCLCLSLPLLEAVLELLEQML